jgi:hypothetical protein
MTWCPADVGSDTMELESPPSLPAEMKSHVTDAREVAEEFLIKITRFKRNTRTKLSLLGDQPSARSEVKPVTDIYFRNTEYIKSESTHVNVLCIYRFIIKTKWYICLSFLTRRNSYKSGVPEYLCCIVLFQYQLSIGVKFNSLFGPKFIQHCEQSSYYGDATAILYT